MIKICGQNDPVFARAAEDAGVDYLGFIFFAKSPRNVTLDRASEIVSALKGTAKRVGVFVNEPLGSIREKAKALGLSVIQLHGPYAASDAAALKSDGYEVWKAVHDAVDPEYPADGFVIDAKPGELPGGTGKRSDWALVEKAHEAGAKAILAGGISAANLKEALETGCDILDVNSSLETAPGVKSIERLKALMTALKEAK